MTLKGPKKKKDFLQNIRENFFMTLCKLLKITAPAPQGFSHFFFGISISTTIILFFQLKQNECEREK
jgi:hypothetical protein